MKEFIFITKNNHNFSSDIFQMLESIGSSRIEGNNTTVAEYVETVIEGKKLKDKRDIEIHNLENAMVFIDNNIESIKCESTC